MEEHPIIRAWVAGIVTIAIVTAYFLTPLMRFADPALLASLGCIFGVSAGVTWIAERSDWGKWWQRGPLAVVVVSAAGIAVLLNVASIASTANDERCLIIQKDMFSASPKRSDGPGLFQALGCRPQGTGKVVYTSKAGLPGSAVIPSKP